MNNSITYAEQQVLKAYNKDRPAGPDNMPQGCKQTTPLLTPTPKETAEYHHAISKSQVRGYETDQEKYLVRGYERQYTTKRD